MAKFRFSQDKQITTWVRDFYYIEAESLEDAIAIVEDANEPLEQLECHDNRVTFDECDTDNSFQWMLENNDIPKRYSITCCDTDEEVVDNY